MSRDDRTIELYNVDLRVLDRLIVKGYNRWVEEASNYWKADGFITSNSPIIVISCYDRNVRIPAQGNEEDVAWDLERDYSKIVYLTFALTTSIKCVPCDVSMGSLS
jgi:hypothetical protein